MRLPAVTFAPGASATLAALVACVEICWTNAGVTPVVAVGVTAFDAADGGPVPTAFVAATVNVYVVPFVRPAIVVPVAGGEPVTVVAVRAVEPMYGVTV
jgi:hypothetical protein